MSSSDAKPLSSIGFLTVRDYQELGLIGGYLVLNSVGRPLEFHCTAPVRPNRAQEILYGPTLKPFLYGEQIGRALLAKGKQEPRFICTDVEEVVALREHIAVPVVYLERANSSGPPAAGEEEKLRIDAAHPPTPPRHGPRIEFAGYAASLRTSHEAADRQLLEAWSADRHELDLMEPFQRLAEAIDETQGGATRS